MKSSPLKICCAASALLLCLSCAGGPGNSPSAVPGNTYREAKAGELRELAGKDPALAAERALVLLAGAGESGPGLGADELRSIVRLASDRFAGEYSEGISGGDYEKSAAALRSLRTLAAGAPAPDCLSDRARALAASGTALDAELLAADAESLYGRGLETAAFLVYGDALRAGLDSGPDHPAASADAAPASAAAAASGTSLPAGTAASDAGILHCASLAVWGARALKAGSRMALSMYSDYLKKAGLALPDGAEALLSSRDSMSDMKKGVVTIRVDRGIKIEDGMGVPDRVLGTGFYIDRNGYVLTNYHVISSEVDPAYEGYSSLSIRPSDSPETRIPGKVVGYDRLLDLAVIKVEAKPDYVFSFDLAAEPQSGAHIYVIGSPVGLENTITSGIVSASGRRLLSTGSVIQIDAAVNPGNSGGPMLDENGRVLGVAFAGLASYQGLNFAIPSSWILRVLPELMRGGEIKRAWAGLSLADSAAQEAQSTQSSKATPIAPSAPPSAAGSAAGGADSAQPAVLSVKPHLLVSYAALNMASGVAMGDYLLSIDGSAFSRIEQAQMFMLGRRPGELVSIGLRGADGRERKVLSALGERPYSPLEQAVQSDRKERLFPVLFGMEVLSTGASFLEGGSYSVSKIYPGSTADEGGLSENDPFNLRNFIVDKKQRAVFIQIHVKKRKAGFLDSIIQIGASLDSPDFI